MNRKRHVRHLPVLLVLPVGYESSVFIAAVALAVVAVIVSQMLRQYARRSAEKVNDLTRRYIQVFNINLVPMSFYGPDGMLIDLNQAMRQLCCFDEAGEAFFRQTCMFDIPLFKDDFDPSSSESFHVCQHMYYPEAGVDRYIEFRLTPAYEDGRLKFYVITARDLTASRLIDREQRQREKELERIARVISRYEEELARLLSSNDMYVWNYSLATEQIVFTRSLCRQEYVETFDEYLDSLFEDERQLSTDSMKRLLVAPKPFSMVRHFRYSPESDRPQWHAISGMPTFDDQGRLTGLFGVLRCLDDLMNAQEQLRKERTRAEASGMMKSAFLANMTHEIRTPLNAIVGFSDLLQVVDDPADRQEFIRIIRNNCDMLLRLINDILESADTGQILTIEPAEVDIAETFDDICQTLQQRVQEPGVQFLKDNPYEHFRTSLDKGRVQQVITNFVTNAVKYTRQGHIKVGYRYEKGGLYFYCEDTGTGIPKDKQDSVFERFVKLNDFVQGTGLGLSICRSIAERCGGKIGVTSDGEDTGSTFWMWIPCEQII